jgi:hypothetical protein
VRWLDDLAQAASAYTPMYDAWSWRQRTSAELGSWQVHVHTARTTNVSRRLSHLACEAFPGLGIVVSAFDARGVHTARDELSNEARLIERRTIERHHDAHTASVGFWPEKRHGLRPQALLAICHRRDRRDAQRRVQSASDGAAEQGQDSVERRQDLRLTSSER